MLKIQKEKYDYYYNNRTGKEVITVCYLLTDNNVVGRGVAVLSEQDEHDAMVGKKLAKNYAIRAIKGRSVDAFKRKEVVDLLIACKCPFTKKGERNPDLSWWERKFLFGAKNMREYVAGIGSVEFLWKQAKEGSLLAQILGQNFYNRNLP